MAETDNGVATISAVATSTITTFSSRRLKREDYSRTKHDSAFSDWKTLIGPSDWEDHAQGEEGTERYRVKNLPNCTSCPGVYELGIVLPRHRSKTGRETSKLDPDFIVAVYLGKSDKVRNRLQQYGRDGAHLENGSSNCKLNDRGPGLFSEIFAKGFSIVYRWAPMKDSREAEKTEVRLLENFDYAWNKGSNGRRRRDDILKKIDRSLKTPQFLQKLRLFPQRRKGIKIKPCELPFLEDGHNFYTGFAPNNFIGRVIKFGRSQPQVVPWRSGIDEYSPSICGVALGHGVVCRKPPSEGRKRCAEHKGKKINATSSNLLVDSRFTVASDKHRIENDTSAVCGVILPDGSSCTMEPVQGKKRCLEHKGRKVHDSSPQSLQPKKEYIHAPILDYDKNQNTLPRKAGRQNTSPGGQVAVKDSNIICGVDLEDGTFCTRQPPSGRKRCEEHKGIRLKEVSSKSFTEKVPRVFDSSGSKSCSREGKKNHAFLPSVFSDKSSPTCGAPLQNGSYCTRKSSGRCWQHKFDASSGSSSAIYSSYGSVYGDDSQTCGAPLQNGCYCTRKSSGRCWQHKVDASSGSSSAIYSSDGSVYGDDSQTCGAPLQNGSYCRRKSSGRCWQHKVDASSGSSSYGSYYHDTASRYSSYGSVYGGASQTCGAPTQNGSYCRRRSCGPCWQHGG